MAADRSSDAKLVDMTRRLLSRDAPHFIPDFEADLGCAVRQVGDGTPGAVREVALRWAGAAVLYADPLTADEVAALARFRVGDTRGLHARGADGTWRTL